MLVDFIVHGIRGPHRNCDIFSYFDPREKLLIEFNNDVELQDYSLSRCVLNDKSSNGFYPDGFQLVLSTPGAPNSCNENQLVNQVFHLFDCNEIPLDNAQSDNVNEDRQCTVLINELNTGSPGILHNMDFIELFAQCKSKKNPRSLQGYKLIGISAGSGDSDRMLIDLVVNLWNTKWTTDGFFTIGTPTVGNTQLTTESPYVVYRNKFSGKTRNNQMFMLTGNRHMS